jgi:hypothetical protein
VDVQKSGKGGTMFAQKLRQLLIPLILAVGLLIIFAYIAWKVTQTSGQAPRLADVAPTTPPSLAPGAKDYPPQYRGGFDENARLLALIAIVSPLLTTIVGFYFGQHAGEASARATQARASQKDAQIEKIAYQNPNSSAREFVDELKRQGVMGNQL